MGALHVYFMGFFSRKGFWFIDKT